MFRVNAGRTHKACCKRVNVLHPGAMGSFPFTTAGEEGDEALPEGWGDVRDTVVLENLGEALVKPS